MHSTGSREASHPRAEMDLACASSRWMNHLPTCRTRCGYGARCPSPKSLSAATTGRSRLNSVRKAPGLRCSPARWATPHPVLSPSTLARFRPDATCSQAIIATSAACRVCALCWTWLSIASPEQRRLDALPAASSYRVRAVGGVSPTASMFPHALTKVRNVGFRNDLHRVRSQTPENAFVLPSCDASTGHAGKLWEVEWLFPL